MQLTSVFVILATGLSLAAAQDGAEPTTTTSSTTTTTRTVTITRCTSCVSSTTVMPTTEVPTTPVAEPTYPLGNATIVATGPTAPALNSSLTTGPTSMRPVTATSTSTVVGSGSTGVSGANGANPSSVVTAGAAGLFAQSGLLLGLIGAGIAVLA